MNELWILAYVITPAIVLVMGYAAVIYHERSLKR